MQENKSQKLMLSDGKVLSNVNANEFIAVGVGNFFALVESDDIKGIEIKKSNTIVKVGNEKYDLFKGETFNDSQKLDFLLDKNKEFSIKKYSVKQHAR